MPRVTVSASRRSRPARRPRQSVRTPLHFAPPQHGKSNDCAAGQVPVADAFKNQALYDNLVDSFSMRAFVPTEGINGHDQFFATFARFGGMKDHSGEWLDEVATRAAAQNEQYLEIMQTPTFSNAASSATRSAGRRRREAPSLPHSLRDCATS